MNVNIYHKHKDIIITIFIVASRAYLQQSYSFFLYLLSLSDFEFYSTSYWATWARTLSCYLPFQTSLELCPNMYFVTMILGVSIYLYKSLCPICKLLRQDLSLKNYYSNIP